MGKKLKKFGSYFWNHKFMWSSAIFILIIGFLDSNSILDRWNINVENNRLRAEIRKYEIQCSKDSAKLKRLMSSPEAMIKVARETHLMKADNEDVYIVTIKPSNTEE